MPVIGFKSRSALRSVVEDGATAWLARNKKSKVIIFGVNGGYEARSPDRGVPKSSNVVLRTMVFEGAPEPELKPPSPEDILLAEKAFADNLKIAHADLTDEQKAAALTQLLAAREAPSKPGAGQRVGQPARQVAH